MLARRGSEMGDDIRRNANIDFVVAASIPRNTRDRAMGQRPLAVD
jgi:hypothetical protein